MGEIPVLILNWNGWDDSFQALAALRAFGGADEAWLIDNGSDEDRSEEVRDAFPKTRIIRLTRNFGWAGGHNRALALALQEGKEFVYLLNNDARPAAGFLEQAFEVALRHPDVAAVGSRILFASAPTFVRFDGTYYRLGEKAMSSSSGVCWTRRVCGAGMLLNLRAFQDVGLFDEDFFCYHEEADWGQRAARKGWKLCVAPASVIFHREKGSDVNANARYYRTRNKYLMLKHAPKARGTPPLPLLWSDIRQACNLRKARRCEEAAAVAQAVWDVVLHRYGPRPAPPPALVRYILTHLWPISTGSLDRVHSLIRHPR